MTRQQITNLLYWAAFAAIGFYFLYLKGWIFAPFESITPQQAREMLRSDAPLTLLDARTPEEFAEKHIEGATLIPLQTLGENLPRLANVKEKKILVYCRSGSRSVSASRLLVENGFHPVNLEGGIVQWESEGLEVMR